MPATDQRPLTSRLKDDNWDLHQIAEKRSELSLLLRGQLPRERYVALLGQAWLEAVALDGALTGACAARADIDALVEPDQHFAPHAREDLDYLKGPARPEPTPGTARFVAFVQEHRGDPLTILGLHYVRLGACNGNSFVARKARAVYRLPESGQGTRWLDPFGPDQRLKWQEFKNRLDAVAWTPQERDRIFAGVRAMYLLAINAGSEVAATEAELLAAHGHELDKEEFTRAHAPVAHAASSGRHLDLTE